MKLIQQNSTQKNILIATNIATKRMLYKAIVFYHKLLNYAQSMRNRLLSKYMKRILSFIFQL